MSLSTCIRCGATLTEVFRFCPACGLSHDDDGGWVLPPEPKAPLSFPVVERPRVREARRTAWRPRNRLSGIRVPRRVFAYPHRFLARLGVRARRLGAGIGEAARLLTEAVLVIGASALGGLRSLVVVRRLHAYRAAVIYSTGCAALSGDVRRVEHARTELRMLDELITAATAGSVPAREARWRSIADVPTQESVLAQPRRRF